MDPVDDYLWPWDAYAWLSPTALGLVALLLLARRVPEIRARLARHRWAAALAVIALAPLSAGAVGDLVYDAARASGSARLAANARFGAAFAIALAFSAALGRLAELWLLSGGKGRDGALPQLERNLLYGFALFAGGFVFLAVEGHSPAELYLSTGAVAAVLAFMLQQTLGDLFSGIALSLERPFRLGDWLRLDDGSEGQVIDLNWRATRLRGWDNATLVVPNSVLARQGFHNLHGAGHRHSPWYHVRLPGEVDPRLAKALLLEAALRCARTLSDPLPVVRLVDAATLPYTYMVWVHFPSYPANFAGREELFREVHYALKSAGIQASPTVEEIHHRRVDARAVEPPLAKTSLESIDLSNLLSEDEIERIASMSQRGFHDAGAVLLREGEVAESLSVVVAGLVEANVRLTDGACKTVERLRPGEYFGIASMLANEPSPVEFQAATDVWVVTVDRDCLRSVLSDRADLTEAFAEIVQRRMRRADEARRAANRPVPRLQLKDLVQRVEASLGFKR
ncbi:MAG: mechanosensitive ion channel family protein [Pseudomonadota bacterium]